MGVKLRSRINITSATRHDYFQTSNASGTRDCALSFFTCIGTRIKRAYEAIQTMCMIIRTNNKLNRDRLMALQLPIWRTPQLCITRNYEPVSSIF
jgi:hypothetical protein